MKSRKSCAKHAKVAVRVALLSGFAALTVQIPLASAAWMLSPTFGVQHFFAKRFSIGLDVGLQYARFSQKTNLSDFPTLNSSANGYSSGTLTRILLRTYF